MKGVGVAISSAVLIVLGLLAMAKWTVSGDALERAKEVAKERSPLEFSGTTSSAWRVYQSAVGEFQVLFPAYPQHASEKVPVPNTELVLEYNIYVAEPDEFSSFMVSLITYPEQLGVSRAENILQTVMNEMLSSNPYNKLTDVKMGDWKGNPLLDFTIENQDLGIQNRAIMVGHTLYLLTGTFTKDSRSQGDFSRFVESFQYVPGQLEAAFRQMDPSE